mmetsp:Transcript_48429/g.135290  ORF Transcript_48429/g.135290 Transcript_48429/m.135290 type:complete len:269 (-) Transcript_48429:1779-2585(-)
MGPEFSLCTHRGNHCILLRRPSATGDLSRRRVLPLLPREDLWFVCSPSELSLLCALFPSTNEASTPRRGSASEPLLLQTYSARGRSLAAACSRRRPCLRDAPAAAMPLLTPAAGPATSNVGGPTCLEGPAAAAKAAGPCSRSSAGQTPPAAAVALVPLDATLGGEAAAPELKAAVMPPIGKRDACCPCCKCRRKSVTQGKCLFFEATSTGASLSLFTRAASAPQSSKRCKQSSCPIDAASWRAVLPLSPAAFKSACQSKRTFTTEAYP